MRLPDRAKTTTWVVLGIALVLPLGVTFMYFVLLQRAPTVVQQTSYVIGKSVQFLLPAVWCLLVLREPPRLPIRGWAGVPTGLMFGLVIGFAMWLLFATVLEPNRYFVEAALVVQSKMRGWGITNVGAFIRLAAFYAFVHSLLEEYYWRWFVYRHLSYRLPEVPANLISSLGFMAHHVLLLGFYFGWASPLTYIFSVAVAIGGACWAWLYERTGSLLGPWLSHLLIDAAIFVVGFHLVYEIFVS